MEIGKIEQLRQEYVNVWYPNFKKIYQLVEKDILDFANVWVTDFGDICDGEDEFEFYDMLTEQGHRKYYCFPYFTIDFRTKLDDKFHNLVAEVLELEYDKDDNYYRVLISSAADIVKLFEKLKNLNKQINTEKVQVITEIKRKFNLGFDIHDGLYQKIDNLNTIGQLGLSADNENKRNIYLSIFVPNKWNPSWSKDTNIEDLNVEELKHISNNMTPFDDQLVRLLSGIVDRKDFNEIVERAKRY